MRKSFSVAALFGLAVSAQALTYSFIPNPADLGDLSHQSAITWGLNWDIPAGQQITSATLTIKNIWDWQYGEKDALFIHLLDDPKTRVTTYADNTWDNVIQDYFAGKGVLLDTWSDPAGGRSRNFDYVYTFSAANLSTLNSYLTDTTTRADFGFGFDADCHYYNSGVSFKIETAPKCVPPPSVPDGGSTLAMLGLGFLATLGVSRKLRTGVR